MTLLADLVTVTDEERAAWLVPCDRRGAGQHQRCTSPGGVPHGARRPLAAEHSRLDPGTGEWLTRRW